LRRADDVSDDGINPANPRLSCTATNVYGYATIIVSMDLKIRVDRGDGAGFVFLAIDLRPDYDDTAPLPAPGQAAVWKYRAIYRLNDAQVGQ